MKTIANIIPVVFMCIACAAAPGCKQDLPNLPCDEDTVVQCICDDGNFGVRECIDGITGPECICEAPANAEPCANRTTDGLVDVLTRVGDCPLSPEGFYVECRAETIPDENEPTRNVYCEKKSDNSTEVTTYNFPKFGTGDFLYEGCLMLNQVCCGSDADECISDNSTVPVE